SARCSARKASQRVPRSPLSGNGDAKTRIQCTPRLCNSPIPSLGLRANRPSLLHESFRTGGRSAAHLSDRSSSQLHAVVLGSVLLRGRDHCAERRASSGRVGSAADEIRGLTNSVGNQRLISTHAKT